MPSVISRDFTTTTPSMSGLALVPREDAHSADLAQFASGLTGINVTLDNASTRILYGTVGLICLMVVVVRFFNWFNALIRHVTSFDSEPIQQNYWKYNNNSFWPWMKKNIIYAPINKVRHNREMRLTESTNMGTLPGRLDLILLGFYMASNVVYCLMLDYTVSIQQAAIAEFRGRTGHLSALNMILLFVLSGRNNPFIRILQIPFDTFNLYHRWIGRVVIIEGVAHTVAWLVNKHTALGWDGVGAALMKDPFLQYGMLGTAGMVLVFLLAPSPVRHAAYETFLIIHQFLAFVILIGTLAHCQLGPLPQLPYVIGICCIWFYDRLWRFFKLLRRNFSATRGYPTVVVEALAAEACRVTFHLPNHFAPAPGTHVYAYLPTISYWQSHPFSVAWSEQHSKHARKPSVDVAQNEKSVKATSKTASSVSLIMARRTGMTKHLYDRAVANGGVYKTIGFLEGPYGALESLHSYGTVLLFAGGVGITHMMPHLRDLIKRREDRTAAIRKIVLVWSFKDRASLEWVRPWMEQILAMESRREVLEIRMFVTRPKNPEEVRSPSNRVQMFPGRPPITEIVWEVFEKRIGALSIGVCGAGPLSDDVRAASRSIVEEGKVDFWEEAFTW